MYVLSNSKKLYFKFKLFHRDELFSYELDFLHFNFKRDLKWKKKMET